MSTTVKLTGILTDVFPVENTSPNFAKRVFWLKEPDTNRQPQHWAIQLHNKDTERLKGVNIGDVLECEVEVRGKKFDSRGEEKIFISLKCVGVRLLEKLPDVPGFTAKTKPGREPDGDRQQPQTALPL